MFHSRSGTQNKILNYFFLNEENRLYINELARLIQADPKNVHRILLKLEEEGILASEFKGKERYFFCNKRNPLYRGYKDIFLKTAGLEALLKKEIESIQGTREAYIFGSYAAKRYGPESDIDILLIGRHKPLSAQRVLYKVQRDIGREVNVVNLTPEEFKKRRAGGDQLMKGIFSRKVIKIL